MPRNAGHPEHKDSPPVGWYCVRLGIVTRGNGCLACQDETSVALLRQKLPGVPPPSNFVQTAEALSRGDVREAGLVVGPVQEPRCQEAGWPTLSAAPTGTHCPRNDARLPSVQCAYRHHPVAGDLQVPENHTGAVGAMN